MNVYEIGVIGSRDSCLHFLNKSIPFFPKTDVLLKPREQRFIKIDIPLIGKTSGLDMIKLLDLKMGCADTINVKFIRNTVFLDVTYSSSETHIFSDEAMSVVDLRSIGYYKIIQSTMQHHFETSFFYITIRVLR